MDAAASSRRNPTEGPDPEIGEAYSTLVRAAAVASADDLAWVSPAKGSGTTLAAVGAPTRPPLTRRPQPDLRRATDRMIDEWHAEQTQA